MFALPFPPLVKGDTGGFYIAEQIPPAPLFQRGEILIYFFVVNSMDAEIVINTDLNGFIMLDRVLEVSTSHIVGTRSFSDAPVYSGLESLAQLGAYHVRYLTGFSRHVFLIKIAHCSLPSKCIPEGEYLLSGTLLSQSDSSFSCRLKAEKEGKPLMEGEFLFAAVDYDHNFKKGKLRRHYVKVFSCLQKDSKIGC